MARTHRSLYRFELWNPVSGFVADLSDICTRRAFTMSLNRAETLDLEFDLHVLEERAQKIGLTPQEMLGAGINDIHVWRANKPIFGARVRFIRATVAASQTLSLHASGYLDDFIHRYLWPVDGVQGGETQYVIADIGQIIWDMAQTSQARDNGDLGITEGVIQNSRLLTDTWQPFASNLKEIFIALTERLNSVDISFTYDRKLNIHYPFQGQYKTELLFSYPGNIQSITAPIDASEVVNVSINRGSGNGVDVTPIRTRTDAASMAIYSRMERIDDYSDVSVNATLDSYGDETLRTNASPLIIPDVVLKSREEPPLGAYGIGDWVRFEIPNRPSFTEVHGQEMRIHEIAVSLNDMDTEEVRLTVGKS